MKDKLCRCGTAPYCEVHNKINSSWLTEAEIYKPTCLELLRQLAQQSDTIQLLLTTLRHIKTEHLTPGSPLYKEVSVVIAKAEVTCTTPHRPL